MKKTTQEYSIRYAPRSWRQRQQNRNCDLPVESEVGSEIVSADGAVAVEVGQTVEIDAIELAAVDA